jgi:CarboxypepD_reg-like domain
VKSILLRTIWIAGAMLLVLAIDSQVFAQTKRVIQLSGVVLGEDSVSGLPGVHVYVPKAGRGTTTNHVGFFSMPVLIGDSIVVSSVGYERQFYIVPNDAPEYQTVIVQLVQDATYLREIVVLDFPTEEVFKQAVLALNVPVDKNIDSKNLHQELLALMVKTTPMDGYQNQRYALNQWANSANDRFQPVTNPFLNPFNWVKFFNSLKKDKKKK